MPSKTAATRGSKRSLSERNEAHRQRTSSADEADVSRSSASDVNNDDASPSKRRRSTAKTGGENESDKHSSAEHSKRVDQDADDSAAAANDEPGRLLTSTLTFLQAILKPPKQDVGTQTSVSLVKRKIKEIEKRLTEQEMAELQIALEMHRDVNGPGPA